MTSVFHALAPPGPIKSVDQHWDVFLSYRSVNRPWVLRLYDQMRHLGCEVFMDQFVLTTGGGLNMQLAQHLERSANDLVFPQRKTEVVNLRATVHSVESRCGAVAVGSVCLLPPLSSGGARVTSP